MIRWGILSTARIGEEFVRAVRADGQSTVVAVASRDGSRAERWASKLGLDDSYGSYEELIDRRNIDAVYVPLPNSMHVEWSVRALDAGKHVLVEKLFRVAKAVVGKMRAQRSGTVVGISSDVAINMSFLESMYAASKWALEAMSLGMRYELQQFGIHDCAASALEPRCAGCRRHERSNCRR